MPVLIPELTESIHRLYPTFAKYRSSHVEGCSCCVSDEDKRRMLSKRLDQLTVDDVQRYSWKAVTTWGSVEDFKHFLPRLFELMATDECSAIEPEILLGKLQLAEWQTWPESERRNVMGFLSALWKNCLTAETGSVWVDELLCGIGHAVDDLLPFLQSWMDCRTKTGYAHLIHFVDWNFSTVLKRKHLQNSFWTDALPQMFQVIDWLSDPKTARGLEAVFNESPESEFSTELANAVDRISALQQSLVTNKTTP